MGPDMVQAVDAKGPGCKDQRYQTLKIHKEGQKGGDRRLRGLREFPKTEWSLPSAVRKKECEETLHKPLCWVLWL